jgi:hypothetical protein
MMQRSFAAVFLGLMGLQAMGLLLGTTLPLWLHRADAYYSLQGLDNQAVQATSEREKPRRPQTPEDFSWVDGVEHFRGKPLLVLAIPKALEAANNERFVRMHSREFRWDGQMYDIVRTRAGEDTTWYTVYADHKEDNLRARRDQANNPMRLGSSPDPQDPAGPALPSPEQQRRLISQLPGPGLLPATWTTTHRLMLSVEALPCAGQFREQFLPPETPPPQESLS